MYLRQSQAPIVILDRSGDTARALTNCVPSHPVQHIEDRDALLQLLTRSHRDQRPQRAGLILLDEATVNGDLGGLLQCLRRSSASRWAPIVVIGKPKSHDEITRAYEWGVSAYLVRPENADELVQALEVVAAYWLDSVQVPAAFFD